MNPLKNLLRKFIADPSSGSIISQWLAPRIYTRQNLLDLFQGYVYGSITAITDMVCSAEFYVEQENRKTGESVVVPNHPFMKVFENPNPVDTTRTLLEGLFTDYKMYGEAFLVVTRGENTGLPMELDKVHPLNMQEVIDHSTGELKGWKYAAYNASDVPLSLDEVVQIKGYNPKNRYRGWGVLQAALNYVLTEKYGTQFTANFLENNAIPGGVFSIKKDMTADDFKKLEEKFRQKYQGTGNAGKILLIKNSEATFEKMGSSLADVGLKDLKVMTSETILNMFKVPKQELGIPDNINLATSQELARGFARRVEYDLDRFTDALDPLMAEYAKLVNRTRTNKIDYELCYESIVPEDTELKLKIVESGLKNGYLTINEARGMVPWGLPPIDNGDTVNLPSYLVGTGTSQPVGSPIQPKKKKPAVITVRHKKAKRKVKDAPVRKQVTLQQFNEYRREKWKAMKPYMERATTGLKEFYQSQYEALLNSGQYDLDLKREANRFKGVMRPILNELSGKQYEVATMLQTKMQKDMTTDEYIAQRLDKFAESSLGGISDRLKKLLKQASDENWSAEQTKDELKKLYADATDAKLLTIARTELNAVSNYSAELAYQDMGYTYKVWFANPDACPICEELDGKIISIEDSFIGLGEKIPTTNTTNDFVEVGAPPAHVNCVLPDTEVVSPDATKLMRAHYSGDIIEITLASGRRLSVTPNHMILTARGWIVAKSLTKGDDVISCTDEIVPAGVNPDDNDRPAIVEDIFDAASVCDGVSTVSVPASAEHLHGDAAAVNGNIDIIDSNGLLRDALDSMMTKEFAKSLLDRAGAYLTSLTGKSNLSTMLKTLSLASDGIVGERRLASLLTGGQLTDKESDSLSDPATYNARFKQALLDSPPVNADALGDTLLAFSRVVSTDNIVNIEVKPYHGQVYDVSSESKLYLANGIISSNCKCDEVPSMEPGSSPFEFPAFSDREDVAALANE